MNNLTISDKFIALHRWFYSLKFLLLFLLLATLLPVKGYSQSPLAAGTVTASGSYVVPPGVTAITVEAIGGGGAGGYSFNNGSPTGGGGGGGYSKVFILQVTPGDILEIEIGKGGIGESGISPGGNTSMRLNGNFLISATGGGGAEDGDGASRGEGGQTENDYGDLKYNGGNGGLGKGNGNDKSFCGGGGGGAGRTGNGGDGNDGSESDTTVNRSNGGIGNYPGGNGGNGTKGKTPLATAGSAYGGGGGGGKGGNGGNGADGVMFISFCPVWTLTGVTAPTTCANITSTDITFTGNTMGLAPGTYSATYTVNGEEYTANNIVLSKSANTYTGVIRNVPIPAESTSTTVTITKLAWGGNIDQSCSAVEIYENNTVVITRLPTPEKPTISPTDHMICTSTGEGIMTAEGTYTSPTYRWYINKQVMAQTTKSITVSQTASYYVIVTDNGCSISSDTSNFLVQAYAVANQIEANPVDACTGSAATLTAALATGANVADPVFRWYTDQTSSDILHTGATFTTDILTAPTVARDTTFYVSVAGSVKYCENVPGTRLPVKVAIHPTPSVKIKTSGNTTFCHNKTINLKAEITGEYSWMGWFDTPEKSGAFEPSTNNIIDLVYNPATSSQGKDIKVYVNVNTLGCGYISDTVYLHILPEPTAAGLKIIEQPREPQDICVDTFYVVKLTAPDKGDLTNLSLILHDVNSTGLVIEKAATITYSSGTTATITGTEPKHPIDRPGVQWNFAGTDTLKVGDELEVKIKVQPGCDFYSGTELHFSFDAQSVCGDVIPRVDKDTDPFYIEQDGNYNTYGLSSRFIDSKGNDIIKVTNNISDTITWHIEAWFKDFETATDGSKERVNILIPTGMELIPNSYDTIQNMLTSAEITAMGDSIAFEKQDNGMNISIPIKSGLDTLSPYRGKMIAELKFLADTTVCGLYEFYAEIDYKYSATCTSSGSTCTVNATQGAAPDKEVLLEVERYRFDIDKVYSETRADSNSETGYYWDADIQVRAVMDWFAGDEIHIYFYNDDENDGIIRADQQPIAQHVYITENIPAGGTFTDHYKNIPVKPDQQLLIMVTGKSLCDTQLEPMIVLTGDKNVACENDTLTFTTAVNEDGLITNYEWGVVIVDAVSGATPKRIPLEGETDINAVPNIARSVWPKAGKFLVSVLYDLNQDELNTTYFSVTIEKAPAMTFTTGEVYNLCAGDSVIIKVDTVAASSIAWSNYSQLGSASGSTTTELHFTAKQHTTDTTFYIRATIYCKEDGVCKPVTDSVQINIYGKPEFDFADTTTCGSADLTQLQLKSGSKERVLDFSYFWHDKENDKWEEVTNDATNITQSGTYKIVGVGAYNCSDSSTVEVTIKPLPQLIIADTDEEQMVCSVSTVVDPGLSTDIDGTTTYNITSTAAAGITGNTSATGLSAFPKDILTTSATTPGYVSYSITPIVNGCEGASQTYTVTVYPIPVLTLDTAAATQCSNITVASPGLRSSVTGIPTTYDITSTAVGVTGNTFDISTVFLNDKLVCKGTTAGTVTYTITPVVHGCRGESKTYTVTVHPLPKATITANDVCEGDNVTFTVELTSGESSPSWVFSYSDGSDTEVIEENVEGPGKTKTINAGTSAEVGSYTYTLGYVKDGNSCTTNYNLQNP